MSRFPGRTLEELDQMDYGRLMRAMEADSIGQVEQMRVQTKDMSKIPADVLEQIARHDAIVGDE